VREAQANQMSYKAALSVGINLAQAKKETQQTSQENRERNPVGLGNRGYRKRAERSFREYAGVLAR
jgi:hypothetical protein